jgi:ferredoxin
MADHDAKVAGNVPGPFYVDDNCIDCGVCIETAPNNFAQNEDDGFAYVFKQPENDAERQACREALEECPVEAIGEDG